MKINAYSPAFTGIKGYAVKDKTNPQEKVEFDIQDEKAHMFVIGGYDNNKLAFDRDSADKVPGLESGNVYEEIKITEITEHSSVELLETKKTDSVKVGKVIDGAKLFLCDAKGTVDLIGENAKLIFNGHGEATVGDIKGKVFSNSKGCFYISSDTEKFISVEGMEVGSMFKRLLSPDKQMECLVDSLGRKVVGQSLNISA